MMAEDGEGEVMARIDTTYYQNAALAAYAPTPSTWRHLYAAPLMAESDGQEVSQFGRDGFRGVGFRGVGSAAEMSAEYVAALNAETKRAQDAAVAQKSLVAAVAGLGVWWFFFRRGK